MAISNFAIVSSDQWNRMSSGYTRIAPVVTGSGTMDPNLQVVMYVSNSDNTAFVMQLSSNGSESLLLSQDPTVADQLDLQCIISAGGQGTIYYSFNESEGWTSSFDMSISLTNTNSSKGKMTFTKGSGERPHR